VVRASSAFRVGFAAGEDGPAGGKGEVADGSLVTDELPAPLPGSHFPGVNGRAPGKAPGDQAQSVCNGERAQLRRVRISGVYGDMRLLGSVGVKWKQYDTRNEQTSQTMKDLYAAIYVRNFHNGVDGVDVVTIGASTIGYLEKDDPRATQVTEITNALASTSAHELGHLFGLTHRSAFGADGVTMTDASKVFTPRS
jgi:hypothetical protein